MLSESSPTTPISPSMETGTRGITQQPVLPTDVPKRRRAGTLHTCHFCGRTFKRSEHKERHVRTHTKEKPFKCHCGAAFTRRDLLTRHQRMVARCHQGKPPRASRRDSAPKKMDDPVKKEAVAQVPLPDMTANSNSWDPQRRESTDTFSSNSHINDEFAKAISAPEFQQSIQSQDFSGTGADLSDFHQFPDFHNPSDAHGLPGDWGPYSHEAMADEYPLDPLLGESAAGGAMTNVRDPLSSSLFDSWFSTEPQKSDVADANAEGSKDEHIMP